MSWTLWGQLEKDAADNVEKAQAAFAALKASEAGVLAKMERVEDSQLLMVQKKRELARLAEELEVGLLVCCLLAAALRCVCVRVPGGVS